MSEAVGRQRFGRPVRRPTNLKLTSTARTIERVFAVDPMDGKRGRADASQAGWPCCWKKASCGLTDKFGKRCSQAQWCPDGTDDVLASSQNWRRNESAASFQC